MAQFDMKQHERNERRKVVMKQWARLTNEAQQTLLHIVTAEAKRSDIFQTCITCSKFESLDAADGNGESIERCKLVGKRPPAAIIADGCEKYTNLLDDDIPF